MDMNEIFSNITIHLSKVKSANIATIFASIRLYRLITIFLISFVDININCLLSTFFTTRTLIWIILFYFNSI